MIEDKDVKKTPNGTLRLRESSPVRINLEEELSP